MENELSSRLSLYRDKLFTPTSGSDTRTGTIGNMLEGAGGTGALVEPFSLDDSDSGIHARIEVCQSTLAKLQEENPSVAPVYQYYKDKIGRRGEETIKAVIGRDEAYVNNYRDFDSLLEIIVRTDGTRPAFAVKNGAVDETSSPVGEWKAILDKSRAALQTAFQSIGRIELNGVHQGTGFLVASNLIMTNRHVLQAIAAVNADGKITIKPGAVINWGREWGVPSTQLPQSIKEVVFCGGDEISAANINHKLLDLVLLVLEAVPDTAVRPHLALNADPAWPDPHNTVVYVVGYPGRPQMQLYNLDMLDLLFGPTFGYKHLAPGKVVPGNGTEPWTVSHDASTTNGNSGSVILIQSQETVAAGIHYGGTTAAPRQNWGHVIGAVLNAGTANVASPSDFKACLQSHGLQITS